MWKPRRPILSGLAVVAIVLLLAGAWVPIPYYSEGPGPARDVLPRITFQGEPRYDPTGHLDLTTVRFLQLTPLTALRAWIDDTLTILPRDDVYPPDVPVQVTDQRGVSQMDQSKIAATAVALRALGMYPKDHGAGALIEQTVDNCPADGKLFPGDVITAVDGKAIKDAEHASALFDKIPVAQPLRFTLNVDGQTEHATFTRAPCGPDDKPLVGISMIDAFPFDVQFSSEDIGGPSAGLMWAIGLYDLLTPEDLTAGRTIAGTGALGPDGRVYPIGGIADKVVAAERAGATIFLAPKANMADLEGVDTGSMQVIPVRTFDEAVAALRQGTSAT
jgi:PDZ domain-containing protein